MVMVCCEQGYPYIFQPGGTFPHIGGTCGSVLDKDFWWALGKDKKNEWNKQQGPAAPPPMEKNAPPFKTSFNFLKKNTLQKTHL